MDKILKLEESSKIPKDIVYAWYKKSHQRYEPSEQITRDYEKPFDKYIRFGKIPKKRPMDTRIQNLLAWINHEPVTLVSSQQADFVKRTQSSIGQIKESEILHLPADTTYGKKIIRDEFGTADTMRDLDLKDEAQFWWQCVQDLNIFRRKIKKYLPNVRFVDIESDMSCLDKKYVGVLSENEVFTILKKYHIQPNKEFLVPLMDTLQLRKNGNINYRELLGLLNWKRDLPILPKMKQTVASSKLISTYAESIGTVSTVDGKKIRTAGLPSERSDFLLTILPRAGIIPDTENLGDQTSIRALISPNIFTKYGLSHMDFFKARNKKELRDIFENIGFEFPENSFNIFWQKGLQIDRTDGVSVETFRQLLASNMMQKYICG